MLNCLNRYVDAFASLPEGIEWAEANADCREDVTLSIRGGKAAECQSAAKTAIYLRVSDGQREGTVYTENLEDDPQALLLSALKNARLCGQGGSSPIHRGGTEHRGESLRADVQTMLETGASLEREVLQNQGVHVLELTVRGSSAERQVVNSRGLNRSHAHSYYFLTLTVELDRPASPYPRAQVKASARQLDDIDLAALAARAVSKAALSDGCGLLPRVTLPSGSYDCVLSAAVTCNILATAWQEFSGAAMTAGAAIYRPEQGAVIGSAALNMTDSPHVPGWGYNLALDSEGTINTSKAIVRQGRLVSPLHTLTSSDGAAGGNAGRAALLTGVTPVSIITIPSIFYIEPGDQPPEALISAMGSGVHLTYSLDVFHSINITSGEYSIPCGGIIYRNGCPIGITSQMTMAGNLRDLFGGILAAGNDLTLDEFQYKNYCYGGPSLLIHGLTLSCMD